MHVFPEFLEVYRAEADCEHDVRTWFRIKDLEWDIYHDGERVAVITLSARLLQTLHDEAVRLSQARNPLIANWGRHLLEDWRSLELLAEKQRVSAD